VAQCIQSHDRYAKKHGYRYFQPAQVDSEGRPPSWGKVVVLKALMKEHPDIDYFFWLDADALITNPHIKLDPICTKLEKSKRHMLVSVDGGGNMNLGVFLMKRTDTTVAILDLLWKQENLINHCWWEGAAIFQIYPQVFQALLVTRENNLFNSYLSGESPWRFGDFILHFAGISGNARAVLSEKISQLVALADPLLPKP
jgi:hypothetical protein